MTIRHEHAEQILTARGFPNVYPLTHWIVDAETHLALGLIG